MNKNLLIFILYFYCHCFTEDLVKNQSNKPHICHCVWMQYNKEQCQQQFMWLNIWKRYQLSEKLDSILCPASQTVTSPFLQISFSPICSDIINKREPNMTYYFSFCLFFAPKLSWKNIHLGNSRKKILNFWPNWSILMCWVT